MQLAAQIFYRQAEYARAAELFQKSEALGGASAELSTNILAGLVSSGQGAAAVEYAQRVANSAASGSEESSQFELFYNHGVPRAWQLAVPPAAPAPLPPQCSPRSRRPPVATARSLRRDLDGRPAVGQAAALPCDRVVSRDALRRRLHGGGGRGQPPIPPIPPPHVLL